MGENKLENILETFNTLSLEVEGPNITQELNSEFHNYSISPSKVKLENWRNTLPKLFFIFSKVSSDLEYVASFIFDELLNLIQQITEASTNTSLIISEKNNPECDHSEMIKTQTELTKKYDDLVSKHESSIKSHNEIVQQKDMEIKSLQSEITELKLQSKSTIDALQTAKENFSLNQQELVKEASIKARTEVLEATKEASDKISKENRDLMLQNDQLSGIIEQLEAENKSYLEKIISSSKTSADASIPSLKFSERKEITLRQPSKKQLMKTRIANSRELTLKQLKEAIEEIYQSKVKFDEKCLESKQARETMDQFLYTHLNQKYGLKTLIGEWSVLILKAIEKYQFQDSEVNLFSKILNHRINEEFRFTFEKLKDNIRQALKAKIQQRNPYMREIQLNALLKEKINGSLDQDEWEAIVLSMFSQDEAGFMLDTIKSSIEDQAAKLVIGKRNKLVPSKSEVTYSLVQNTILSYDLSSHEALLEPFYKEFIEQDIDRNGILLEEEFKSLCSRLDLTSEFDRLLDQVDPNNTGLINYSDCVNLFTYEIIPEENSSGLSILHNLFFKSQANT